MSEKIMIDPIKLGALKSIRVLDLSRVRAGPACVRMLADFGADVIRIEPPAGVDPNEAMFAGDRLGGDFQNLNRNKRSLTLNLKKPEARDIFYQLVKDADVVVENWRPDVKSRLGLDYESLKKINPRIILASISGFGQDGPYVRRPGFDQIIQGMSGLMSVTGLPGQGPVRAGLAVGDMGAGAFAAIGILLALFERERSGQGQWVDVNLLHSLIALLDFQAARYLVEGDIPTTAGNDHPTSSPMGLYQASDGDFNLGCSGEGTWQRLCDAIERNDLLEHPLYRIEKQRVENRQALNSILEPIFKAHTVQYWVETLNAKGVPAGPVYTMPQVFDDAQVKHLGIAGQVNSSEMGVIQLVNSPVRLSRTPAQLVCAAPGWGEHSDEVLTELGLQASQIEQLRKDGAI